MVATIKSESQKDYYTQPTTPPTTTTSPTNTELLNKSADLLTQSNLQIDQLLELLKDLHIMTDHWEDSFNKEKDKNNKLVEQLKEKDKSYLELKEKLAFLTRVLESERKEEKIKRMKERSYLAIKEHKYNKLLKRCKEAEKRCDDLEQHCASEKQNTDT